MHKGLCQSYRRKRAELPTSCQPSCASSCSQLLLPTAFQAAARCCHMATTRLFAPGRCRQGAARNPACGKPASCIGALPVQPQEAGRASISCQPSCASSCLQPLPADRVPRSCAVHSTTLLPTPVAAGERWLPGAVARPPRALEAPPVLPREAGRAAFQWSAYASVPFADNVADCAHATALCCDMSTTRSFMRGRCMRASGGPDRLMCRRLGQSYRQAALSQAGCDAWGQAAVNACRVPPKNMLTCAGSVPPGRLRRMRPGGCLSAARVPPPQACAWSLQPGSRQRAICVL